MSLSRLFNNYHLRVSSNQARTIRLFSAHPAPMKINFILAMQITGGYKERKKQDLLTEMREMRLGSSVPMSERAELEMHIAKMGMSIEEKEKMHMGFVEEMERERMRLMRLEAENCLPFVFMNQGISTGR
ncbi:hypothetical protein SBOR_1816 [Sclerotinia borealis F-4128]|uniref:Uncharacterized protein n=1 Tax=Sclerotinia borealis (strain F-4128) TaxID=1432307 RepID=W9CM22_SCLBF|nr:hypothetical protein SBOR_1816 [Sclerotinia borealis F-4128]